MANSLGTLPIRIDTDLVSFSATQTLKAGGMSVRPYKITVTSNAVSVAGTLTITRPTDGGALYPPLVITAGAPAGTSMYVDSIDNLLTWADFSVTGVSATSTVLWIWYR